MFFKVRRSQCGLPTTLVIQEAEETVLNLLAWGWTVTFGSDGSEGLDVKLTGIGGGGGGQFGGSRGAGEEQVDGGVTLITGGDNGGLLGGELDGRGGGGGGGRFTKIMPLVLCSCPSGVGLLIVIFGLELLLSVMVIGLGDVIAPFKGLGAIITPLLLSVIITGLGEITALLLGAVWVVPEALLGPFGQIGVDGRRGVVGGVGQGKTDATVTALFLFPFAVFVPFEESVVVFVLGSAPFFVDHHRGCHCEARCRREEREWIEAARALALLTTTGHM
nr:unnamed protein product [Callosobruchus chinensis]